MPKKVEIAIPPAQVINFINTNRMVTNFVGMARIDTVSDESKAETNQVPSTESQRDFAYMLNEQLKNIRSVKNVVVDKFAVVTATLPSNVQMSAKQIPTVGLFAHMDIADDVPTDHITPRIHEKYKGGDLKLDHGTVIPKEELIELIGDDIITTDGRTLLGADDKAGIAEIIEVLHFYDEHPEIPRPKIRIGFTPDEEIGRGLDFFNVKKFGASAAYTIDGSVPGELEAETFNAHMVKIIFKGTNVHPGFAKGKMVNSLRALADFITKLPRNEAPETTEGRQGYIHPDSIEDRSVEESSLTLIVRDFNYKGSLSRIKKLEKLVEEVRKLNPGCTIEMKVKEQYKNMKEYIAKKPEVINYAKQGIKDTGLQLIEKAIRGGTDGSSLSVMGLPTPNLAAGGHLFHSKKEFLAVGDMKKCAATIINTMSAWVRELGKRT